MALLAMNNMMPAQNDETQRYPDQSDSAKIENVIVLDSNREPMQLKWETDYTLFVFLPSNVCGKPDQCCCHKMLGSRKSQVAALSMLAENRNKWQQKYNVKIFAVVNKDCSDGKESKKLEDFVKKNNLRLPLVYDFKNDLSNLAKSNREIGKRHSPLLFLVDKNGKIKYFDMEFQEGDDLRIETFLKFTHQ